MTANLYTNVRSMIEAATSIRTERQVVKSCEWQTEAEAQGLLDDLWQDDEFMESLFPTENV